MTKRKTLKLPACCNAQRCSSKAYGRALKSEALPAAARPSTRQSFSTGKKARNPLFRSEAAIAKPVDDSSFSCEFYLQTQAAIAKAVAALFDRIFVVVVILYQDQPKFVPGCCTDIPHSHGARNHHGCARSSVHAPWHENLHSTSHQQILLQGSLCGRAHVRRQCPARDCFCLLDSK